MYTTRFCNIDDMDSIARIVDSKKTLGYNIITGENKKNIITYIETKINSKSETDKVAGVFDEDDLLIGFLVVKLSSYHSVWYVYFLYMNNTKVNNLSFSLATNGAKELRNFAYAYTESHGYFESLTCSVPAIFRRYAKIFGKYNERYEFMVECFYSANEKIKFQHHRDYLGGKTTADTDIVFHKMILKPEYRLQLIFKDENKFHALPNTIIE